MASIDIKAMTGLVGAIGDAVSNLPYDEWGMNSTLGSVDVDSSPSSGIGKVSAWAEGAVPGLKRRLALAQAIEAQHPSFQGVVKIDESKLSNLDPTAAQNQGAADAKKLRDSGGKLDPKLIAEIAKYQNDPYFAAGFGTALTPDELADIVQQASNGHSTHPPTSDEYKAWFKQYQQLVSAMGNTVATATRNTGNLALPSDTAQQWVNVFKREPGDDGFRYDEGAALSSLLKYGNYSTPFLNKISTDVYNYERSKDGDAVWGPKAGITMDRLIDPTGNGMTVNIDVMANVLAGLGHNADAAQQFFDVGNPHASTVDVKINGKTYHMNKRLEYLIAERTWATDKGSDDGLGLGQALNEATTFYRNGEQSGKISAEIAGQTFAIIGNKTLDGKSGGDWYALGLNSHPGWKMWDGMRKSVANMVGSYAPDLMRVAGTTDSGSDPLGGDWTHASDSVFPPNGPWGAVMDKDLMSKILGTLGEDPKNIDIVTAGVGAAGQLRMSYALQRALKADPNAPVDMITGDKYVDLVNGASNELAGTLAFIINSGYQGDKSNQDFQKEQAEALSKAMGIALSIPTLAVPEGKPWTGFLIDQAKDIALDKIGEGPDADAKGKYNDTASNTQQNLQHSMLNYLLASGYLDHKYYDKAGKAYVPPPAGAFKTDGHGNRVEPPQFDFGSKAYQDWERSGHNLQPWLNSNVIDPFRDKFPALGAE